MENFVHKSAACYCQDSRLQVSWCMLWLSSLRTPNVIPVWFFFSLFSFFLFFPSYPPSHARSSSFVREFDLTFCCLFYWLDGWMVGSLSRFISLPLVSN